MEITLTVPDDLATRLRPLQDRLPELLELALREWTVGEAGGFTGITQVLEMLASLPTPDEVLALRPSPAMQDRLETLRDKSRLGALAPDEQREWDRYAFTEHLVRLAKARAALKLKGP